MHLLLVLFLLSVVVNHVKGRQTSWLLTKPSAATLPALTTAKQRINQQTSVDELSLLSVSTNEAYESDDFISFSA